MKTAFTMFMNVLNLLVVSPLLPIAALMWCCRLHEIYRTRRWMPSLSHVFCSSIYFRRFFKECAMFPTIRSLICTLLLSGTGAVAQGADTLDGIWTEYSIGALGKVVPVFPSNTSIEIHGKSFALRYNGKVKARAEIEVNREARPHATMDIRFTSSNYADASRQAIYYLKGDKLMICEHRSEGDIRPTNFETDSGETVVRAYKRNQ
ncbi:MAG: hypothetical protein K8U03_25855 [Planctomycetia bacterium]|nr:hypothetical protein [Planctomycetia bacterium]